MIDSKRITDKGAEEFALGMLLLNIKEYRKHMKYIQNHSDSQERRRRKAQIRDIEWFFNSKQCARYLDVITSKVTGPEILKHLKSEFTKENNEND